MDPVLEIASRLYAEYLPEGGDAPWSDEDFVEDPEGHWSFSGQWIYSEHKGGISKSVKWFRLVTTQQYRCARLAVENAKTLIEAFLAEKAKEKISAPNPPLPPARPLPEKLDRFG